MQEKYDTKKKEQNRVFEAEKQLFLLMIIKSIRSFKFF